MRRSLERVVRTRMLEITKIKYTEKPSATHSEATEIIGGLSMHYALTADNREQVPRDRLKDEIAEHIWRKVYGDLRKPLMELQTLAQYSVKPQHYDRVMQLCDQLNALLTRKKEGEQ